MKKPASCGGFFGDNFTHTPQYHISQVTGGASRQFA